MKTVDRTLSWLLVVATVLHCIGCLMAFLHTNPDMLLWTEAAGFMGFMVPAVNLLRVNRPNDRGLAWVCVGGCIGWLVVAVWFGIGLGKLDVRPLIHGLITLGLLGFSLRAAVGKAAISGETAGQPTLA